MVKMVKNPSAGLETWVGKIPWRRAKKPTPVFLPEESPWIEVPDGLQSMGLKESDTTERLSTARDITKSMDTGCDTVCEGEKGIYILWICFPISKMEITSLH